MIKRVIFGVIFVLALLCMSVSCFAASAKLKEKAVTASKGTELSENTIIITLGANEVEKLKDSISISLDGAEWSGYEQSGKINTEVTYEKTSESVLKLHIAVNEKMTADGYVLNLPLKCRITKNISQIIAAVEYGTGYSKSSLAFAKCAVSRAALKGSVMEHKKGDKILRGGNKLLFNSLTITVIGDDVERTKKSITLKYNGAIWSDYNKSGTVENSKNVSTTYTKIDNNTLALQLNDVPPSIMYSGYTLTLPLSGTITGTGEISVTVDFGQDDIKPCTVVFANCPDGAIGISSNKSDTVFGENGRIDGIVVTDSSTQGYKKNTQIIVSPVQAYHFTSAPVAVGEGKFAGKVKAEISKDNNQNCVITMTDVIEAGATGSIRLDGGVVSKSASYEPKGTDIEMSVEAAGWESYFDSAKIGTYTKGANPYGPVSITVKNPSASANMYEQVSVVTVGDNSGRKYSKGDMITLKFDNDFYFFTKLGVPKMTAEGSFGGKVGFAFNEQNRQEAYIVFNGDVDTSVEGSITMDGIVIKRDKADAFGFVNLAAYVKNDPCSYTSAQAGKYNAGLTGTLSEEKVNGESKNEEVSAPAEDNTVKAVFQIGNLEYTIGGEKKELLAAPYIKDGSTMLPMRAVAGIVGIGDDSITFSDGQAVFEMADGKKLVVTAGEKTFAVGNDKKQSATAAEITNGTMFLPMRSLVTALGIADDKIEFNSETKEITIK